MDFMLCLAIARVALLGVGWICRLHFLTISDMTGTVGFYPVGILRSVTTFVKFLSNFHAFGKFSCILVGPSLEIPAL